MNKLPIGISSINKDQHHIGNSKKKYSIISNELRQGFINRVASKKVTIKEAAREYGLKFSTSKAILQIFRKEGRIGKKKTRIRILKQRKNKQEEGDQTVKTFKIEENMTRMNYDRKVDDIKNENSKVFMNSEIMKENYLNNPNISTFLQNELEKYAKNMQTFQNIQNYSYFNYLMSNLSNFNNLNLSILKQNFQNNLLSLQPNFLNQPAFCVRKNPFINLHDINLQHFSHPRNDALNIINSESLEDTIYN